MAVISKAESTPTATSGNGIKESIGEMNNSSVKKAQKAFAKKSSTPPGDWSKCGTPEQEYAFYSSGLKVTSKVKKSTPEEERDFFIELISNERGVSKESAAAEYDYIN